ncbi:hypothetical protein, partial [Providencia hangzhouensis]|uniref:hypothetical protein n=1 Tax=Providencia hangzhouensis TaxID=3031799 RepID=UPI0034DD10B5
LRLNAAEVQSGTWIEILSSLIKQAQRGVIKEKMIKKLTITTVCHFMRICRQAYYKRQDTSDKKRSQMILLSIQ